jgi:hypothetical protein
MDMDNVIDQCNKKVSALQMLGCGGVIYLTLRSAVVRQRKQP